MFTQQVAPYGAIAGQSLPLVVISHGTGGGAASHYDTALALADAGFVVVTLSHTGDNYKDRAYSFTLRQFVDRSRHIARVIDFMLDGWPGHDHIDRQRIGIFGHSAGGATALIVIGGVPDFRLAGKFCSDHPESWDCQRVKERGRPAIDPATTPVWTHDPRVKAAAIASPAIGYMFAGDLAGATAPIQLWRAENDRIAPNPWNADIVKAALPQPPEDHLVPLAGHFAFLAPCSAELAKIAPEICQDDPGFDRAAFHQQLNEALIDFFKARLAPP